MVPTKNHLPNPLISSAAHAPRTVPSTPRRRRLFRRIPNHSHPHLHRRLAHSHVPLTLTRTPRFPDHDVQLHKPLAARQVDFASSGEAELGVDQRVDAVAAFEVAGAVRKIGLFCGWGGVSDGGFGGGVGQELGFWVWGQIGFEFGEW